MTEYVDDIVISGMSGRFPGSSTIEELAEHLYAGIDLITEDESRWPKGVFKIPDGSGKIINLPDFDADFFRIHGRLANKMDPQARLLLEVVYETIVDAGMNITEFNGSKTGVYIAVSESDAKSIHMADTNRITGYELFSCFPTFFANRVSHTFNLKGPSMLIDNGCASSIAALIQGFTALRTGQCDAVIVGATSMTLLPYTTVAVNKLHALSPEARCKTFSANADGYVRSEAVTAILLQRKGDAKRVYATVRAAQCNADGYKAEGFSFPSNAMQCRLNEESLREAGLLPGDISYIEAHGTATQVGDAQEVEAIVNCYCKDRTTPLLIGSIKSNIGHTEASSGLCSIVKVLLSMEKGVIPGNLHYDVPNPDIPALTDGRLKVVSRNTPWTGRLATVNCFGIGGSNGNVILEAEPHAKFDRSLEKSNNELTRLVVACGRTDEAVRKLLDLARNHPCDAGLHSLLDSVHTKNIRGHKYRGYALIGNNNLYHEDVSLVNNIEQSRIWLNFSGDTDIWIDNSRQLMKIPLFASSIVNSDIILKPHGVGLLEIFEKSEKVTDNARVVCHVALQVALVDVLHALEIDIEGSLGNSVGNIGKSYSEGSITAKQAILCAYWYGKYHEETNLKKKSKECAQNVLLNLNYGNKIEKLQDYKDVEDEMDLVENIFESTEINELSTKLKLPEESILIEVGVSFNINILLFNNPVKKYICLLDNHENDLSLSLLQAIGSLYNAGANPQISNIYPPITWPVPRGTPGLSSHVIWDHSTEWHVPHLSEMTRCSENRIEVDLGNVSYSFLCGNEIDGRIVFPASGYLVFVWHVFAIQQRLNLEETPIAFEDLQFKSVITMTKDTPTAFTITILPKSGKFEVVSDDEVVTTGTIRVACDSEAEINKNAALNGHEDDTNLILHNEDVYKELNLRGYNYNGIFKGIRTADLQSQSAEIFWNKNWIAFIDTIFQFSLLKMSTRNIYLPSQVKKIFIDPKNFEDKEKNEVIHIVTQDDKLISTGVKIHEIKWTKKKECKKSTVSLPTLERYLFCSYQYKNNNEFHLKSLQDVLKVYLQIAFENADTLNLKIVEVATKSESLSILPLVQEVLHSEPKTKYNSIHIREFENEISADLQKKHIKVVHAEPHIDLPENDCHLIVTENLSQHPSSRELLSNILQSLSSTGMILIKETRKIEEMESYMKMMKEFDLVVICQTQIEEQFILLRRSREPPKNYAIIDVNDTENYIWVDQLRSALKDSEKDARIYLVANDSYSGILGLTVCLRKEAGGHKIRSYFLPDSSEIFSVDSPTFSEVVRKDLVMNVYRNGHWGSYRHLLLDNPINSELSFYSKLSNGFREKEEYIDEPLNRELLMDPHKCYVIIGGLGGFGLELAFWLILRGARKLVLNGREGITTGHQSYCVQRLLKEGVEILVATDNAANKSGAESLLQKANELGPVGGIFNLAVDLQQASLENQTAEKFRTVAESKIKVTSELDKASQRMAPEIDHFVAFSSITSGRGAYGLINYGFTNSVMERIIEKRVEKGLPGLAIQWGPIGQVGIMMRNSIFEQASVMWGTRLQSVRSCLYVLDSLLIQTNPVVASCIVDQKSDKVHRSHRLDLCKAVADIFGITDLTKLSMSTPLKDLGMDSIMAAEVYHLLNIENDIPINVDGVQMLTFDSLRKFGEDK